MNGGILITAKAWRLRLAAVSAFGQLAIVLWMSGPIAIPGRAVRDVVAPFAPLIMAGALVACSIALSRSSLEVRHPRWRLRRIALVAIVLAAGAVSALAAGAMSQEVLPVVLIRNCSLFVGILLLAGDRHNSEALLALVAYCTVAWILGAGGIGSPPQPWAVPLLGQENHAASVASALVLLAGAGRMLMQPRRIA